ncbi:MAG: CocE/NonD family hydrolase, partial [Acidobacteriota bacterium]|nr:CocE/NonD family hydrolase [Acidobacteriota bacterium]
QRLTIGPWTHTVGFSTEFHLAEMLRWFDYYLKDIDNGIADEAPIHYYVMLGNNTVPESSGQFMSRDEQDAENPDHWIAASNWPPRVADSTYYLSAGRSGTVESVNDGKLLTRKPKKKKGSDDHRVDFTSRMGSFSRWMDGYGEERADRPGTTFFDERTAEDQKALTYTSPPLASDLVILGYPVVHLWVTSTAKDGDFFVYLEEVDAEGRAHYVTEGVLRASFRALEKPTWKNFALPFHRCFKKDRAKKLPKTPVELVFDLMGTAILIDEGHRIRITVAGADHENFALYPKPKKGRPTITLHRNREHRSSIELPVVD